MQEPMVAYSVSANTITFDSPPAIGSTFYGVMLGDIGTVPVPAPGSITADMLASDVRGTNNRIIYTATAGQTVFNISYQVGYVDVYQNGVKLAPADFTATNGLSITLLVPAALNDTVECIGIGVFKYLNANVVREVYTATAGQTVFNLTNAYTPGINNISVFMNGSKLVKTNDYLETNPTVITLTAGAAAQLNDELVFEIAQINTTGETVAAGNVPYVPTGTLGSTNVQAALTELDADVTALSNSVAASLNTVNTQIPGGGSQVTSGTNLTLTSSSNRVQSINMTAAGLNVTLPDATTLSTGGPTYILSAPLGGNTYTVRSNGGGAQGSIAAGAALVISLVDNTTAAGVWQVRPLTDIQQLIVGPTTVSAFAATTPQICGLSVTQAIIAYVSGSTVRAVLVEISALGAVTIGSELTIFTGTALNGPRIAAVSATRAVLVYVQGGTPLGDAVILDVTGSTLSAGTILSGFASTPNVDFFAICRLSATQCLVTYYTSTGSRSRVRTLDISGSSLTAGTQADLNASVTTSNALVPLTATTALAVYGDSTNGNTRGVVCSVSGSTVTANTPAVIAGAGVANRVSLAFISATSAILHFTITAVNIPRLVVVSISGTTPSAGAELALTTTQSQSPSVAMFNSTQGICTYQDSVSVTNYFYRTITVNGTVVTAGTAISFNQNNSGSSANLSPLVAGKVIGCIPPFSAASAQLFETNAGV
jgi:hypothetical protein